MGQTALVLGLAPLLVAARAAAQECHVVDVKLTPGVQASTPTQRHELSQMVAWIETADGQYKDTIFITQQTGRYGLGNRPGRYDFNSGPMWPYGRRIQTFPVWSHRQPLTFPQVIFQNVEGYSQICYTDCTSHGGSATQCQSDCAYPQACEPLTGDAFASCGDNDLSHPFDQSSNEAHFCQPYTPTDPKWMQADAMTCATLAYTDKGKFSQTRTSRYPPRTDLARMASDSPSVEMYRTMNPFDAVSQATPRGGESMKITWSIPPDFPVGNYVLWIEVAQAFDHNDTYSVAAYPPPPAIGDKKIQWATYGLPFRGQPSVVYKVPFTIGSTTTSSQTASYEGYGDPEGLDGALRPPDATITVDTPGSGASRLQLVSDGGLMYRVQVITRPEYDYARPSQPQALSAIDTDTTTATLRFMAPGDDDTVGTVSGYEVRYMADRELTADNFSDGSLVLSTVDVSPPGFAQRIELAGLLPETDYWVGVRAFDDCRNYGPIAIARFTTAPRAAGAVDACFVATAAYGSLMANDVELLRQYRDSILRRSILGELAIETYYTFGPAVAGVVGESELLRASARAVLSPIVTSVRRLAF